MECLVLGHNYAKTGPMHSNDIKDQFLEMHAKGISLSRIATDLHVSQRTLVDWNRQLAPDIRALRAVHLEALHEQTLASREADLARLAKVQTNVEAAITERDFSWVDSDKLVRIYLDLRHEIRALRAADLSPLYEPPNPNLNLNLNLNPNPAPPSSAGILPAEPNDPDPSAPGTLPATHLCVTEPPAQDAHPTPDGPAPISAPPPIKTRLQPGANAPGALETVSNGFPPPSPARPEPSGQAVERSEIPALSGHPGAARIHETAGNPSLTATAQFARRLRESLAEKMSGGIRAILDLAACLSAHPAYSAFIASVAALPLCAVTSQSARALPIITPLCRNSPVCSQPAKGCSSLRSSRLCVFIAPPDPPARPHAVASVPSPTLCGPWAVDRDLRTVDCGLPRISAPFLRSFCLTFSTALFAITSASTISAFPPPCIAQFCSTSDDETVSVNKRSKGRPRPKP